MLLLEHDAKTLLQRAGLPVPPGSLAGSADVLPEGPWVVKAQVTVGGRGKAGGIRLAKSPEDVRAAVTAMIGMSIHGHLVRACRIEQRVSGHEAYLSLSVAPASAGVRLLFSPSGGVDIEALHAAGGVVRAALAAPDRDSVVAAFAPFADAIPVAHRASLRDATRRLADAFFRYEATLLEINPLFLTEAGWVAGDAKMILDADAAPRIPAVQALIRDRRAAYPEAWLKLEEGFDFIEMDPGGRIGMVTTGAGLSMMLIDELTARGLHPFNFCDVRTGQMRGDPRRLIDVLRWIGRGAEIRVVLISVFAGITHLGEFARLLVDAMRQVPTLRVPIVARIIGNGFDEAQLIIAASGLPILVEPDLDRALDAAAHHAGH